MRKIFWQAGTNIALGAAVAAALLAGCEVHKPQPPPRPPATTGPREVTSDLVPWRVLQRDAADEGTLHHAAPCAASGDVFVRVLRDGAPLPRLDWQRAGAAANGTVAATVGHIPLGGPYRVELEVRAADGTCLRAEAADNVLVGDIWLLPGQSNMLGWGDLVDVEEPSPLVHVYGLNERWSLAEEPLHWVDESPDAVHHPGQSAAEIEQARRAPRPPRARGAGLALPFAKELTRRTGVPIGLVPCAHGGTSMDQWSPANRSLDGRSLYSSLLRRARAVGGHVKGVLWYQGEDDAHPETCGSYHAKFVQFIRALRQDLQDPQLPFYYVQIGRTTGYPHTDDAWSKVREDERRVAEELAGVHAVPAIDLELDDHIHVGTAGLKQLGRRLAIVAEHELYGNPAITAGPRLRAVRFEGPNRTNIRVSFADVNGRLRPGTHIAGFSLRTAEGQPGPEFFDVGTDPRDPASVVCQLESPVPPDCQLFYGYGRNPYCNLADEQDMAVPAFGPVKIEPPAGEAPAKR